LGVTDFNSILVGRHEGPVKYLAIYIQLFWDKSWKKISSGKTTNSDSPGKWLLKLKKGKCSLYSITEHRVLELIPGLGSQPAGDVSHIPGGRLQLLSARPAVTLATLTRAATNFAAW